MKNIVLKSLIIPAVVLLFCLAPALCTAKSPIHNFSLREHLFGKDALHIIAQDSAGNDDPGVNGRYTFVINGFEKSVLFIAGRAEFPEDLHSSSFLYMKWEGENRLVPRLFYVLKSGAGFVPFKISLFWLLAIPIGLILLSAVFKKLIYVVVIVFVLFFVFNKGLDVGSYLTAIKDWVFSHL